VSDPTTVTATTNTTPQSCVSVQCDCNTMWSLVQQFSYLRLADETGDFKSKLVKDYAVRARRIAATYARFYLEQEKGCDSAKKGRFYWMALGAFASKTVACTLEAWQVRTQATLVSKKTKEGLGKGNALDYLGEHRPEYSLFPLRRFIYQCLKYIPNFPGFEGEALADGLGPDTVAQRIEGADNDSGRHAGGSFIGDLLIEAD